MAKKNQGNQPEPHQVVYVYPPDVELCSEGSIELRELWNILWQGKWVVITITAIFAFGSVLLALYLPNIYRSEAVLAPSDEAQGGGLAKMAGQLGGLASLAGIDLGAGDGVDKVAIALEVVNSRKFIADFVQRHNILPELMAVEQWEPSGNELIYDGKLYEADKQEWVRDEQPVQPTSWEAYDAFMEILTVSQDKETGFVTVAIEHQSPFIAALWVELLVEDLNAAMKEKDVAEARRSIEYLNNQLSQVALAEMRTVFYQLIEDQIQTMMLADVRDEYIFSTIDPPVIPEEKARPSRALICVIGLLLGGVLGAFFVLIRYFFTHQAKDE